MIITRVVQQNRSIEKLFDGAPYPLILFALPACWPKSCETTIERVSKLEAKPLCGAPYKGLLWKRESCANM